ncbi:MAG: amidohydrolase family protein [Chloroflexota bacterium]
MSAKAMDWLLKNARITDDKPLIDLGIVSGHISIFKAASNVSATKTWDLQGRVVLPGLIDLHTHLDKTYTTLENQSGTLLEAIEVWHKIKHTRSKIDIEKAVEKALRTAIANGVTKMRSHIDLIETGDLDTLEVVQDVQARMNGLIDLELVALGDANGSDENVAVLEQSLVQGVDFIGGAPSLSADSADAIDAAFDMAEQLGKPLDLHIDETEDPAMLALEHLADQTIARGMQGMVTAGHCCSLSFVDPNRARRVIDKVAKAQITVVTLPSCNLVLMGRNMTPTPRGTTPVKALLEQGVNVCAASDNVHDPFNPFGDYDLLQIANINAHTAHLTGEMELYTSLNMVSKFPAQAMSNSNYGLEDGCIADLVVVDTTRVLNAVVSPPSRLATFKAGQLIVKTTVEQTWPSLTEV